MQHIEVSPDATTARADIYDTCQAIMDQYEQFSAPWRTARAIRDRLLKWDALGLNATPCPDAALPKLAQQVHDLTESLGFQVA